MESIHPYREDHRSETAPAGKTWDNPGEFPEFMGDKKSSNIEKLQALLERSGFSELRSNPDEFNAFLEHTDKSDIYRYLQHINQSLRETTVKNRGFHDGRMFVGGMISPNRATQTEILDETIDAIAQMKDDKYRAALGYYQTNLLHLFPDANGRTARTIYTILRHPDFNLIGNSEFISHSDNQSQNDSSGNKVGAFEQMNGLADPREFTQYSMLETLKTIMDEDAEMNDLLQPFYRSFAEAMTGDPRKRANLVLVMGAGAGVEAGKELHSLQQNPSYRNLDEADRERLNYALCDNNALVSIAGLAMLKFHREKGDLPTFLAKYTKQNPRLGNTPQCIINIDPDDAEYFGGCECQDWDIADMLRYADLAEEIKKRQLQTGIDIFAHPESHTTQTGERIADILAR